MTTEQAIRIVIGQGASQADVERVGMQILIESSEEWPEPRIAAIRTAATAVGIAPRV